MMRTFLLSLFFTPLFLFVCCATSSKSDNHEDSNQDVWLLIYVKAKNNSDCASFTQLSQENKFVLKDVALLRARMICADSKPLKKVPDDLLQKYPYLANLNNERMLVEAVNSKDSKLIAEAWLAKALASIHISEKLNFLQNAQNALSSAEKNTDKNLSQDIQTRIYSIAPRLKPNPSPEDYQKVAIDFMYNRNFSEARKYFTRYIKLSSISFEDKYYAKKAYRNSFKTEQNKGQFIVEARNLCNWLEKQKTKNNRFIHEGYMTLARAQWTQGHVKEAKKTLLAAEKILKNKFPLNEIEFVLGRMAEEPGHFKSALVHYELALKDSRPKTIINDRILFAMAWNYRKLKNFAKAADAFLQLKTQTVDPFDKFRYQFWLAKSYLQDKQNEKAKKELKQLQEEDTLGYYGLLAFRELDEKMPPLVEGRSLASTIESNSALDSETQHMIFALIQGEETEILEKYLNLKTQDIKISSPSNSKLWLAYLKSYAAAGLYLPLFAQLGSLEIDLKNQLLKDHPDLLFPRKYVELIDASAEKFDVYPELILSIIRQESAFNPMARSPADAFGLMQVLPSVAKANEKSTGVVIKDHDDLYKPENNIPVGTSLLAKLAKKYRGQFILTAAAYNANEKAIGNWLKTRLKEDPLEFIEDIPYDETRSYVKLVIRNFVFYSRLNNPGKPLAFPNWCLDNLQSFKVSTR